MKKNKSYSLILFIVGILLIILALFLTIIIRNNNKNTDDNFTISNLNITSDNSFKFKIHNNSSNYYKNKKINLYAENNQKKIIMIEEFTIDYLKPHETKEYEFIQEDEFAEKPSLVYAKEYNNSLKVINILPENQLGNILKKYAKEVVEAEYGLVNKNINLAITAKDLEEKYHKDLTEFKNSKYKCSLEESIIEVTWDNENDTYFYSTSIDCQAFYEES